MSKLSIDTTNISNGHFLDKDSLKMKLMLSFTFSEIPMQICTVDVGFLTLSIRRDADPEHAWVFTPAYNPKTKKPQILWDVPSSTGEFTESGAPADIDIFVAADVMVGVLFASPLGAALKGFL